MVEQRSPALAKVNSVVSSQGGGYGDEWEDGWDEEEENAIPDGIMEDDGQEQKKQQFKIMYIDEIRVGVKDRLNDIRDLFEMDDDALIHVARHYRWDQEKMQVEWFDNQARLSYELGIQFKKSLNNDPMINCSTPSKHGGYCIICYEQITA